MNDTISSWMNNITKRIVVTRDTHLPGGVLREEPARPYDGA